ncbi:uncharacterized protein LOC112569569 [Pomacea canaliculata]|uniref:uncharacterized protein LOC112569569 n=1 Tax=Pomacea canaliculata TaxID=400727 RepID=UPI000D739983|nr:uncharacterized protein LOC112569569 [Pomacea canaliculata]
MSCSTQLTQTRQLKCYFPKITTEKIGIAVYFKTKGGNEIRVIDCVILEDLDCNGERGFKCEELSSDYAEFTVPENFSEGSFRCQTPGLAASQITSCQWPPADYKTSASDSTTLSLTDAAAATSVNVSSPDGSALNTDVIAGIAGAVFIVVILLIICIIFLMSSYLSKKNKSKNETESSDSATAEDGECPRNNTISSVEGNNTLDASLSNESEQNTISPVHNIHRSSAQTHEVDCTVADTKTGSREGLFQRNQQSNGSPVDFKNIDRPSAEAHEVDSTIADMKTGSRYKDSETQQNISSEEVKDLKLPLLTNVSTDHYECDGVKTRAQKSNRPRNNSPVDFNNKDQSSDETPDVDYAAEKQSIKFRNKPIPLDLLRESGYSSGVWDTSFQPNQRSSQNF